jgi:hypothetical protein
VSEPTTTPAPAADGKPAAAVIRIIHGAEETAHDRLLKKHVPAWVISGALHVVVLVVFILVGMGGKAETKASEEVVQAVVDPKEDEEKKLDLTNPDIGLQSDLAAAVEVNREADRNVEAPVVADQPVGVAVAESAPVDTPALAGMGADLNNLGLTGDEGNVLKGAGGLGGTTVVNKALAGRSGASKEANLKAGGGNSASEAAVARGMIWLKKKQRENGSWVYDGSSAGDTVAATGMALLPFLAAGQTHKPGKENKYHDVVQKGIRYLIANQLPNGSFKGSSGMYSHAIAAIALCECYGMTGDKATLLLPAKRAIDYIQAGQGRNGSWGYQAKTEGDTSIVGWQVQALQSAKMCKDIPVNDKVLRDAKAFLVSVSTKAGAHYGYTSNASTSPTLSSVGLLCRYYIDGWTALNPSMAAGVTDLLKSPPTDANWNMYYYYYATQVVHFHEGKAWHETWNPKMRDMLVKKQQESAGKADEGSWAADRGMIGQHCGRLGTTCMALLTLEVYYRHLPLYKRDTGGLKELERVK